MSSEDPHPKAKTPGALRLVAGAGGWALVTQLDEPVFSASGAQGRRRCLEFAQREGVLAIFS